MQAACARSDSGRADGTGEVGKHDTEATRTAAKKGIFKPLSRDYAAGPLQEVDGGTAPRRLPKCSWHRLFNDRDPAREKAYIRSVWYVFPDRSAPTRTRRNLAAGRKHFPTCQTGTGSPGRSTRSLCHIFAAFLPAIVERNLRRHGPGVKFPCAGNIRRCIGPVRNTGGI